MRDGVHVTRSVPRLRLGNTPIDPGYSRRVLRAIEAHRPDVVVAHTPVPFPAEMAYAAARRARVPFVVTYHAGRLRGSTVALDGLAALDRATLERRMLAGASHLIAVSAFVRDHALARHRDRVTIVAPGVDGSLFVPAEPPSEDRILFVGPLSSSYRWKGVDVLWRAFELVRQEVPTARLRLVGDGDRFREFAKKAMAPDSRISLAGRVTDEQLVGEYQSASVVVLPSTTEAESFGMVLAEANACGRPVVGSRIGGIPDFVRSGDNGLLAAPADPTDLALKILSLLREPKLAAEIGQRGRDRVLAEHDWGRLAQRTEAVLEKVVQGGTLAPADDASAEPALAA